MSFHRPFPGIASLARPAVAAFVLLAPALMPSVPARAAQPVALSDGTKLAAAPTAGSIASIDQPNPLPPKSLAAKAIMDAFGEIKAVRCAEQVKISGVIPLTHDGEPVEQRNIVLLRHHPHTI